jgi:hypothetical protein
MITILVHRFKYKTQRLAHKRQRVYIYIYMHIYTNVCVYVYINRNRSRSHNQFSMGSHYVAVVFYAWRKSMHVHSVTSWPSMELRCNPLKLHSNQSFLLPLRFSSVVLSVPVFLIRTLYHRFCTFASLLRSSPLFIPFATFCTASVQMCVRQCKRSILLLVLTTVKCTHLNTLHT